MAVTKAQMYREEIATAGSLGMTVDQFRAKYAPWRLTRFEVYERDQGLCRYCGIELATGARMFTLDHIIPWSRGGSELSDNLVAACRVCNNRKGDRTPDEAGMPVLPIPR